MTIIDADKLDEIIVDAVDVSTNEVECQTLRWVLDKISELPSVTPKSSEDCISRQAVIKHLDNITMDTNPDHYGYKDKWHLANGFNLCKVDIETYIENLPPVTPQPTDAVSRDATNEGCWREKEEYFYGLKSKRIWLEPIQALEQEPCEDAISRQEAIKEFQIFREYSSNRSNADWVDRIETVLMHLPSVTPKGEPCEDAISREAAIRVAEQGQIQGYEWQFKKLCNLQPVTPQQKMGHWIRWYERKENDGCIEHVPHCKCSECGKEYEPHSSQFVKYCNKCGAKMEVEE